MSKRVKITKLKELIKHLVVQELKKDDEIDEVSTTATAGIDGTGTGHYDTPRAFASGSQGGHPKPDVVGYKKVNEGYGEMMDELEKIYRPSGAPPIAKEALKDLADEYDIGRVLYAARTNEKSFREVMDMKIDQLQSQYVNKKHINTIKRGKKLKEVTDKEINVIKKVVDNLKKLRQSFTKAMSIGDKELKNREYNKDYETILAAEKAMMAVVLKLKSKKMLGEGSMDWEKDFKWANEKELKVIAKLVHMNNGIAPVIKMSKKPDFKSFIKRAAKKGLGESINEGRYHDWRNDESMTPKQKVGRSMREIRDALNELDRTVKMNLKLKTELKMKSEDYWKNTHKALTKISERLVKMANKIGNLK